MSPAWEPVGPVLGVSGLLALGLAATRNAPIEDTKFGIFRM